MFSNEKLEELKRAVPIHMFARTKMKLEKRGNEYWALCPFKKEDTPSFSIYRSDDGTWMYHCHGCAASGNIFQLVQKLNDVSFAEAAKIVNAMTTDPAWSKKRAAVEAAFQTMSQPKEIKSQPVEKFFQYADALLKSKDAMAWLATRGITQETAIMFSLGFVQKPSPEIVPTNHPWHSQGWILFPEIRDGQIVAVKYRSIVGKRVPKTENSQSWSGFASRPGMLKAVLYNQEAIQPGEDVFVTEGEPDALILAQAGFLACSLPSAGINPNADMRGALMGAGARYLAGDMDEAGVNAMDKLAKELSGDNPKSNTFRLCWPAPHKDANEFFLKHCGGSVATFKGEIFRLMEEARGRRLPGIQDLKSGLRDMDFKPTHDNPNRLAFPWPQIDSWVDILPGEVMFLFGTETKTGKSTWLMNILMHNVSAGKKVINFSAELSPDRYRTLVTAYLTHHNRNTLSPAEFRQAADLLPDDSFYIGYKPGANMKAVMTLLADAKQIYGGDIFCIDPIHFIIRGAENENAAFAAAMKDLVDFAIRWNVIVIVVGQARKSVAGSRGKMAVGQDARFSAALSEDAATTWIIHRNRIPGEDESTVFESATKVKLDYSRNSEARVTKLHFDGETARFNEIETRYEPAADAVMEYEDHA